MKNIYTTTLRLNLDNVADREAWVHLQRLDRAQYRSVNRAVISAVNAYFGRQEQLAAAQENLKAQTGDASAGGGMVKVTVNGEMELVNLTIDPDALDPEDVDMLQDMIMAAVNEAVRGVNELANKQMGAITGGLNIPGMPF